MEKGDDNVCGCELWIVNGELANQELWSPPTLLVLPYD